MAANTVIRRDDNNAGHQLSKYVDECVDLQKKRIADLEKQLVAKDPPVQNKICNACGDNFTVNVAMISEVPAYKKTCGDCIDLMLMNGAGTAKKYKELDRFCCPVCKTPNLKLDDEPHLCGREGEDKRFMLLTANIVSSRSIALGTKRTPEDIKARKAKAAVEKAKANEARAAEEAKKGKGKAKATAGAGEPSAKKRKSEDISARSTPDSDEEED